MVACPSPFSFSAARRRGIAFRRDVRRPGWSGPRTCETQRVTYTRPLIRAFYQVGDRTRNAAGARGPTLRPPPPQPLSPGMVSRKVEGFASWRTCVPLTRGVGAWRVVSVSAHGVVVRHTPLWARLVRVAGARVSRTAPLETSGAAS